ncbi:MAG: hypothetical protein ABIJ18_02055 [archaeon]
MKKVYFILIAAVIILLFFQLIYSENAYTTSDIDEYFKLAEFAATGETNIQLFAAHSAFSPFLIGKLLNSYYSDFLFKLVGFIILLLIGIVLYKETKNELALLLFLLFPVVVGIIGTNSPMLFSGLFFISSYLFLEKFIKTKKIFPLIVSGLLLGFACGFYFLTFIYVFLFILIFFRDIELKYLIIFLGLFSIGLLPKLIFDYLLFGYPFHSMTRLIASNIVARVLASSTNSGSSPLLMLFTDFGKFLRYFIYNFEYIVLVPALGISLWAIIKRFRFKKYANETIFLCLVSTIVVVFGGFSYFAFIFSPLLILMVIRSKPSKKTIIIILISFIVLSSIFAYRGLSISKEYRENYEQLEQDTAQIKIDFEEKEFIFGPDASYISRYFDNTYKFYWWDEYVTNEENYVEVNFEEKPKLENLRIIFFTFGYKRNIQELPEQPLFIFESNKIQRGNFSELKCYRVLCVYEEK